MGELTEALFRRHVARGEVLHVEDGPIGTWATAILVGEQLPAEDSSLRFALLAGDGAAAATLADQTRRLIEETIRFRVPVGAPMTAGHEGRFGALGFVSPPDWEMHVLARRMDEGAPIPAADPARLVLQDPPQPITPVRW